MGGFTIAPKIGWAKNSKQRRYQLRQELWKKMGLYGRHNCKGLRFPTSGGKNLKGLTTFEHL